ncbi:MAG: RHS repeat-associated core domain-containing protein [Verrucomicrobia bacterium]|nr:RHS repeat-associated core domain-containing protein [Verrucomicrobiota bacterium]
MLSAYLNGRLTSVTRKTSSGTQLSQTTYAYDAHGRQSTVTDARNGTTTFTFNAADQAITVTTPAPGTGQPAQVTTTAYNTSLQAWKITQPDGTSVTNEFFLTGLLKKTSGSRTYPVEYTYDPQGRMKTMKTWTNFVAGTGAATTLWTNDVYRGWLEKKVYQGETDTTKDYEYTAAGRLWKRHWERGITTTYAYNNAGDLYTVTYSDGVTPSVTYTYDRRGRQGTVACNGITTTLSYNDANQLLSEAYAGGTLAGLSVVNTYDTYLRRTQLQPKNGSTALMTNTFGYDTASRLQTVTDNSYSATYTYLANSPLVSQIAYKNHITARMTTTKDYDKLNRLQAMSSAPSSSSSLPLTYAYQYNDANQRTRMTLTDGSFWIYTYDALGQVVSGKRYWSDGTAVPGQQNEYTFDDIGNRRATKSGGDAGGAALRAASYTPNLLNQYTSRTVPGGFDVVGIAPAATSVTVNSSSADYRRSEYFQEPITVVNTSVPVWQSVSVTTGGGGSASGNVWTAKTPENYGYDLDGNTTSDGRWNYTWDAENRLTRLVANTAVGPQQRIDLEYDWQGRRIRKKVWNNTGGTGTPAVDFKFVYDGWNLTAELDANASSNLKRSYVWGLDLSGSEQGAGGVGGLLLVKPASGNPLFVAYDGNGNVAGLIDATTGTTSAQYEYGPFGETIRMSGTGTVAKDNPLRFSTKYQDDESDLLYYGYRYYCPSTGRWMSRDPLSERGGRSLYAFVSNGPVARSDFLGLFPWIPILPAPPWVNAELDDWWVFVQLGWHFVIGGGKDFVRENGWWGYYMMAYPALKDVTRYHYSQKAMEALQSGRSAGRYSFYAGVTFGRSLPLQYTLFHTTYRGYGKFCVDRSNQTVTLSKNKHLILDGMDANGWRDGALIALNEGGGPLIVGPIIGTILRAMGVNPLFQYYALEVSWDSPDVVFTIRGGNDVIPQKGTWPYDD